MKKKRDRPRVLFDIDGVFANFIAGALPHIARITGREFHHDEVDQWLIEKALGLDNEQAELLYREVASEGWCRQLPAYEGAREGLERVRQFADVWAVTQPYPSRHWSYERDLWLVEDFGFDINDILHVRSKAKPAIDGDAFVEDKTSTLIAWQEEHPDSFGVLFRRRYNEHEGWNGSWARNWQTLGDVLETHFLRSERSAR